MDEESSSSRQRGPALLRDSDARRRSGEALPSRVEAPQAPQHSSQSITDVVKQDEDEMTRTQARSRLLSLPSELTHHILSYLSYRELTTLSVTCRLLRDEARNDLLWAAFVHSNLPDTIIDPHPFDSFRSLFISHHPYWFVARNKIWISDVEHTGKLILARYDHRRGVIEAYRIVATHGGHEFKAWSWDPDVIIHTFEPVVRLWLDDPVLQLESFRPSESERQREWREGEIRMPMAVEAQRVYNSFFLCKPEKNTTTPNDPEEDDDGDNDDDDSNNSNNNPQRLWPPVTIPAKERVNRDAGTHWFQDWKHKPQRSEDICEFAFRVRRWVGWMTGAVAGFGTGAADALSTYATLDPGLYTPTKKKPYQGIWVGDYAGHGCEFLLFLQRDRASEEMDEEPLSEDAVDGGRLEGIKLTGDPNVPRGEVTFRSEDIGPKGLVRIAEEREFRGARVVRSQGHVAARNFRDDMFIPSQLILISHDRIAQYWEGLGHIAFFQRVDIDKLLHA